MERRTKRTLVFILLLAPAVFIAFTLLTAPKASTPRHDTLPEGNITALLYGTVEDGDGRHDASGTVTLYDNGTGHFLWFAEYRADAGPDVWFYLVADARAESSHAVEDEGVKLRVPGPGMATYRGSFLVPLPGDADPFSFGALVAWDELFNTRYAVAALAAP